MGVGEETDDGSGGGWFSKDRFERDVGTGGGVGILEVLEVRGGVEDGKR